MKRYLIVFAFLILGCQASSQLTSNLEQPEKKMNVILFLVDDMGWADLGCYGSKFHRTPNINRLAKEGVRFTNAYASSHVCSPSRGAIISGQYPARTHLTDWLVGREDFSFQKLKNAPNAQHLPYGQPTLPRLLKDNGYATAIFGKWHLGEDSASTERQGFEEHIPKDWMKGWPNGTYFSPYNMSNLEDGPDGEYLTDKLTSEAMKWVEQKKDEPFFLFLSHFAVHDPIEGQPKIVEKYERILKRNNRVGDKPYILEENPDSKSSKTREELDNLLLSEDYQGFKMFPDRTVKIKQYQDNPQFAAMVESVDNSVKTVVERLEELGLSDNTIIVFASDNGGMSAANFYNPKRQIPLSMLNASFATSVLPLRGGKGWNYEGGNRVPLIIYWPKKGSHGVVSHVPVINVDYYPTVMDMLGIPLPEDYPLDGVSMVPILKDSKEETSKLRERPLFWHFPHYSNHGGQSPGGAVRIGDYKLIERFENFTVQLFNLRRDPGEQHDLSKEMPEKVEELRESLHTWRTDIKANMPMENPDYDPGIGNQWQNWVQPKND